MKTTLDNIIYYVEHVETSQWDNFVLGLEVAETYGKVPRIKREIGHGFSKYHHNIRIGEGAGAIHIGYKHNTSPENEDSYRLRFEMNPKELPDIQEKARRNALDIFLEAVARNTKLIKGIDVAFDIPIAKDRLYVVSKTGRERQIIKGTVYYGQRGQHGQLKIYDKKKEILKKQGVEISEEHLTRIEFSLRLDEPLTFHLFNKRKEWGIDELYQVSELKIGKSEGMIKAIIIALNTGEFQMGELSRTYQNKTKKALADMGLLHLDHAYTNAHSEFSMCLRAVLNAKAAV